jgi:hypothetical protein
MAFPDTTTALNDPGRPLSRDDRNALRDASLRAQMVRAYEALETALGHIDDQVDDIARDGCEWRATQMIQRIERATHVLMGRAV